MTVYPTIHLNGTSKRELLEQTATALTALRHAIVALHAAAPNGRDYYPQGPTAINTAIHDHKRRLSKLAEVRDELESIAISISEA